VYPLLRSSVTRSEVWPSEVPVLILLAGGNGTRFANPVRLSRLAGEAAGGGANPGSKNGGV